MDTNAIDIFISYSWADNSKGVVKAIEDELLDELRVKHPKIRLFRDESNLRKNDTVTASIDEALNRSRHLLIVFSENWRVSKFCQSEFEHYLRSRKIGKSSHPTSTYQISCLWLANFDNERNTLPYPLSILPSYRFYRGQGDATLKLKPKEINSTDDFSRLVGDLRRLFTVMKMSSENCPRTVLLSQVAYANQEKHFKINQGLAQELATQGILAYPPPHLGNSESSYDYLNDPNIYFPQTTPLIQLHSTAKDTTLALLEEAKKAISRGYRVLLWDENSANSQGNFPEWALRLDGVRPYTCDFTEFIKTIDDSLPYWSDSLIRSQSPEARQERDGDPSGSNAYRLGILSDDTNCVRADDFICRLSCEIQGRFDRLRRLPKDPDRSFLQTYRALLMIYGAAELPNDLSDEQLILLANEGRNRQVTNANFFCSFSNRNDVSSESFLLRSPPPLERVPWPNQGPKRMDKLGNERHEQQLIDAIKQSLSSIS